LSTYARPGQRWTFFEIDPAIERIARDPAYFTYLEACGEKCRVVIGDARLSLNRVPERAYDLLVIDAFSSDSIPMHLMTREALSLYLSRLAPGAALVMHISNRHLLLGPEVASLAASLHLVALQQVDRTNGAWPEGKSESHWVVVARNAADLGALASDTRWSHMQASPKTPVWTDDFSNILSVLSVR
jgi:spermidine synthase